MRNYLFLFCAACLFGHAAQAQTADSLRSEAPRYEAIWAETANPTSPYYYPTLMSRYERGDTTLTLEDFRHLYYGYPEQPGYKPLLNSPYADSLQNIFGQKQIFLSLQP